jgi:hypothetical protein
MSPSRDLHDDHLAALTMVGTAGVSHGLYTPDRVDLMLSAGDQSTDLIVYTHEVHHQALNDSTAWGAALHVLSALGPAQRTCFGPMLDACRRPHEAFATFAAVSVVAVYDPDAVEVLARFPRYDRLYRALADVAAAAGGPHREYLLATALARAAMQSPVLSVMLASADLTVVPSDLRRIDTPDGRWQWLMRAGRALTEDAAADADRRITQALGSAGLQVDTPVQPRAAAVDTFDAYWELWERAAYTVLADALTGAGATVLSFNGHMEPTAEVLERAREMDPMLSLRAARPHSPAPNDAALSGSVIQYIRLTLADPPRRAQLTTVPLSELAPVAFDDTDAQFQDEVVVHARLPRRMLDSYRWLADDAAVLESLDHPVVAVRRIEPIAAESVIAHTLLAAPEQLRELRRHLPAPAATITVAGASCFIDDAWSSDWIALMREAGQLVVLIDIEAERFVGSWVRSALTVRAGIFRVNDTTGVFWASALRIGEDPAIWLHLADEVTVKLLLDQLRATTGLRLDLSPAHARNCATVLSHVITELLATESFLDLQGLDRATVRRVTAAQIADQKDPRSATASDS